MKRAFPETALWLFLVVAISFLSPWALSYADSTSKSKASKGPAASDSGGAEENPLNDESDCVRGEPEPVLKNSRFKRLTRLTATEAYQVSPDVSLGIRHFGCAHFAESYHFKVKRKTSKPEDWRFWMKFAADRLEALPVRNGTDAQIKSMVATLRDQVKSATTYAYDSEIFISEAALLSFNVTSMGNDSSGIVVVYQYIL
jgi:hypothetical protein